MSEENPNSEIEEPALVSDETYKLLSDDFEEFQEALEILYIKDNLSGRLVFLKDWPQAAAFVFGEELIAFDTEGTQDRNRRSALEDEAEHKRLKILDLLKDVEQKSVHEGALQMDFIGQVFEDLGSDIARHVYAQRIIEKIVPDLNVDEAPREEVREQSVEQQIPETEPSEPKMPQSPEAAPPIEPSAPPAEEVVPPVQEEAPIIEESKPESPEPEAQEKPAPATTQTIKAPPPIKRKIKAPPPVKKT